MNKKRKFQDEQLGLLRPIHKSYDRTFTLGPKKSQSNTIPEVENIYTSITKDKMDGGDESDDQDSAKGSNSFQGDHLDSVLCVSGEVKTDLGYQKMSTGSSSSVNCASFSEKLGYGESDSVDIDFGLHASMNYDERVLEFELRNDGIEECTEKEIEDLLCSNGASSDKFVLSSGRWDVNQENENGAKSLTIDKEFEQYFSMLML